MTSDPISIVRNTLRATFELVREIRAGQGETDG
jgi:hypothetical protein